MISLFWEEVAFLNTDSFVLSPSVFSSALDVTYVPAILRDVVVEMHSLSPEEYFSIQDIQQVRASKCHFQDKYSHKVTRVPTL